VSLHSKLDEIVSAIESARAMPMSASCIVNRGEMLALLDELRDQLPEQIAEAEVVLRDRESVVEEGRVEAAQIVDAARRERARLVAKTDVVQAATDEAERIVVEAETETDRMRAEIDAYVDTKLANFEVVLGKTLAAVERGREKLRGRHPLDDLREGAVDDETPLPG
jgi:cell division septum initiation protein DivIVA